MTIEYSYPVATLVQNSQVPHQKRVLDVMVVRGQPHIHNGAEPGEISQSQHTLSI